MKPKPEVMLRMPKLLEVSVMLAVSSPLMALLNTPFHQMLIPLGISAHLLVEEAWRTWMGYRNRSLVKSGSHVEEYGDCANRHEDAHDDHSGGEANDRGEYHEDEGDFRWDSVDHGVSSNSSTNADVEARRK